MSEWREDNFLERLANTWPKRAERGLCPKAETLSACVDSEDGTVISEELRQHINHCPVCSDLLSRLELFDQSDSLSVGPEEIEAERRLDSWLKGFLASQATRRDSRSVAAIRDRKTDPTFIRKPRPFWRLQWALAAAAVLIIGLGVVYIWRSTTALLPHSDVARRTPEPEPPLVSASRTTPEPAPLENHQPKDSVHKSSPAHQSPKVFSPAQPVAPTVTSGPPAGEEQAPQVVAQAAPQTDSTPKEAQSTRPITSPTIQPSRVALSPKMPGSPAQVPHPAPQSTKTLSSTPSSRIYLPAGTRIWIKLDSVTPDAEGSFQFHGTLLLSITNSGAVLVDKNSRVFGQGKTVKGQTSIEITGITRRGQHYKASSVSRTVSAGPASGRTVSFENGQVLEMWLDSASVFQAELGSDSSPQK